MVVYCEIVVGLVSVAPGSKADDEIIEDGTMQDRIEMKVHVCNDEDEGVANEDLLD